MLGACDRRVPLDDGKRYVSRLKQSDHAPDTRVVVFEKDEHGLTRPQTDFEQWITCLWWLRHHGCGTSDASEHAFPNRMTFQTRKLKVNEWLAFR
jgi:acylaminoacyl-peptidase